MASRSSLAFTEFLSWDLKRFVDLRAIPSPLPKLILMVREKEKISRWWQLSYLDPFPQPAFPPSGSPVFLVGVKPEGQIPLSQLDVLAYHK
jgi:hypothetical protein